MEIFIDSASISEIEKWLEMGVIDGVTTNPSIMFKDGIYDAETGAKEIAALVDPRPVSVEVTTNDLSEMIIQAQRFASWASNIVVKIPQITQDGIPCYGVIRQLESESFHTVIVAGDAPDGTDVKHAWLLVEVVSGEYMPVEAMAFSIVYWGSPYFDNYFKYERQFETIQEALAYDPTEFDWWEL